MNSYKILELTSDDLKVFADLGSYFDEEYSENDSVTWRFVMGSEKVSVTASNVGKTQITLNVGGRVENFVNAKALLASSMFGDLHQWARNQKTKLAPDLPRYEIQTSGFFSPNVGSSHKEEVNLANLDAKISEIEGSYNLHVLVIDGPAGIGKTTQIQRLAKLRASSYPTERGKLLLHVESRGRILQNITDLISASLHSIRVKVTCDQLLVLVKHGLVILAIDGFDELADPNGYHMAWSQLDELLQEINGNAQVILSGRETFVSPGRMIKSLPAISAGEACISQYTIDEVTPTEGRNFLRLQGWQEGDLRSKQLDEILSAGSYAARPFFLYALSEREVFEQFQDKSAVDLLGILVASLISREVEKFGDDILRALPRPTIEKYLYQVCEEIARDMADAQSEFLPGQTVKFISEMCIPEAIPNDIRKIIIHRAASLPFLTNAEGKNSVKFAHRQYFIHFLSMSSVNAICDEEVPKFVRHNFLGSEFLEGFWRAIQDISAKKIGSFQKSCIELLGELSAYDRSLGNISSLLLSSCCRLPLNQELTLTGISIDEVLLAEELENVSFVECSISTLYARSADLSDVKFDEKCLVISLHADERTVLGEDFPQPTWIELPDRTLSDHGLIREFVDQFKSVKGFEVEMPANPDLLYRILRYKPFWMKLEVDNDEPVVQRIVRHKDWDRCFEWLTQNELLRIEERDVSGASGTFVHFRKSQIAEFLIDKLKNAKKLK